MLRFSFRGRRRQINDRPSDNESISRHARKKVGLVFILVFFSLFLIAGMAGSYFLLVRPLWLYVVSEDWVQVPCTILSSKVDTHSDSDGTTYSIDIEYKYTYNNIEYKCDRYDFIGGSSSGYRGKQRIVEKYPPGSESLCLVNPEEPSYAVLVRRLGATMLFGLIPGFFVLIGGGALARAFFVLRKDKTQAFSKDDSPVLPRDRSDFSGPAEFTAGKSRLGRVVAGIIVTLVWNGITGGILYHLLSSEGNLEWTPVIVLGVFQLIGIVLILGTIASILALCNPSVRLVLNPGKVRLGEPFELRWNLLGSPNRINRFRILIEGIEKATYRRGTRTYTDTSTFTAFELFETQAPRDMVDGEIGTLLPPDTMHSFNASNNRIIWKLKVKGEIAWWPDISDEFELQVLPQGSS